MMNRREALRNVALFLGTAISASTTDILFSSYTLPENEKNSVVFTADQIKTLGEIADIIIPTTKTSLGAKAAGVGKFIPMMINDCYPAKNQHSFYNGLTAFEDIAKKSHQKSFFLLTLSQRKALVEKLRETTIAQQKDKNKENADLAYFFKITRDLTSLGYFSSEIGCTQARTYLAIPGKYDGAYPLKPGQKSWAT